MFGKKKDDIVTGDLPRYQPASVYTEVAASTPVVKDVKVDGTFVIPMSQDKQPDPVYGFDPVRDESKFTGQGFAYQSPVKGDTTGQD